jgi:fructuronate reductase
MRFEIAPTLAAPPGVHIGDYGAELMRRFRNPALPHRTRQIAMDGSQKLPQRLLGTIRDNLAAGRSIDRLALSVAGWMRYVYGRDEKGATIDVADPLSARFATLAGAHRDDPAAFASGILAIDAVFGGDLPRDPRFTKPAIAWLMSLFANGAARTMQQCHARNPSAPTA